MGAEDSIKKLKRKENTKKKREEDSEMGSSLPAQEGAHLLVLVVLVL